MKVQCKECDREYDRPPERRCPGCGAYAYAPAESDEERGFRNGYQGWPPTPPLHPRKAREYHRGYADGTNQRSRAFLDAQATKEGS